MRHTQHHMYPVWKEMKRRCHTATHRDFEYYGGRGIRVCKRWLKSFWNFVADVGRRPSLQHTLDRKNNDGNYTPKNVRWATKSEQGLNRRDNCMLTANGRTQPLTAWANELKVERNTLTYRKRRGWTDSETINTPIRRHRVR